MSKQLGARLRVRIGVGDRITVGVGVGVGLPCELAARCLGSTQHQAASQAAGQAASQATGQAAHQATHWAQAAVASISSSRDHGTALAAAVGAMTSRATDWQAFTGSMQYVASPWASASPSPNPTQHRGKRENSAITKPLAEP